MPRPPVTITGIIGTVMLVTWLMVSPPVQAGPITNGPGSAPFTKLGVYQGVVTVVSSAGNVLEIGNLGREIADTTSLYFRPGVLTQANGLSVVRNGTSADVFVNGNVCLFTHPSGPYVCRNTWPASTPASKWAQASSPSDTYTGYDGIFLQPLSTNYGLHIGSVGTPFTAGTAVSLDSGGNGDALDIANPGLGAAVQIQAGKLQFNGDTTIANRLYINVQEVWHAGDFGFAKNEGQGSGLDADILNGNNVTLEAATSCIDEPGHLRAACICFTIYRSGSTTKHCAPLSNE